MFYSNMSCCLRRVCPALWATYNLTANYKNPKQPTVQKKPEKYYSAVTARSMELPTISFAFELDRSVRPVLPQLYPPQHSSPGISGGEKGEEKEKLRNLKFVWNLFPWTFHTFEQIMFWFHSNRKTTLHNAKRHTPKTKQVKNNCINQNLQRG